jgi:hypothetical protein
LDGRSAWQCPKKDFLDSLESGYLLEKVGRNDDGRRALGRDLLK